MTEAWAVYRELAHSPGRETDDALILRAVAEKLEKRGFSVGMKTPDEVIDEPSAPPLVLVMCEQVGILDTLRRWEERGSLLINSPDGIFETYRHRMIEAFARHRVQHPQSCLVSTNGVGQAILPVLADRKDKQDCLSSNFPLWVKRADVHATQEGDVQFAAGEAALATALAAFKSRGIDRAVLQEHVPGDLIKFYGVGTGADAWFIWFYHKHQTLSGYAFDPAHLRAAARKAADAIGVGVFGGDAIAQQNGELPIIDLNAWPSFALYRDEASEQIAAYAASAVEGRRQKAEGSSALADASPSAFCLLPSKSSIGE